MASQAQQQETLRDFKRWSQWLAEEGGDVLRTPGAIHWIIRRHRKRLIDSGQLIVRSGPGGHLVGPRFGDEVLAILREESAANA